MIFPHIFITVALLIAVGYLQDSPVPESMYTRSHEFSLSDLPALLTLYAVAFAPLVPLVLALIRGLTNFRLHRGLAFVLAGLTGLFGFMITLFGGAFSGGGAPIAWLQGFTLTIAVCASLLLASRKEGVVSDFPRFSWKLLMLPAVVALWSLVSVGGVVLSANRIAGDRPFCLAPHTGKTEPVRSFAQLRGLSFYTTDSGYKVTSMWYFHGLLFVAHESGGVFYNWSPRRMRFDRIAHPTEMFVSPIGACSPRKDFWRTLSII